MTDFAWSTEAAADVTAIVTLACAGVATPPTVFDGRARQGENPPFVTCWQLGPENVGRALARESFGLNHQQWQIGAHGRTQMEARLLAEAIVGYAWPAGWEYVETGPLILDQDDAPDSWWFPLTFVYRIVS